jgi:hypothetical protein
VNRGGGSAALCNVGGERKVPLHLSEVGYMLEWKS